MAKKNKKQTEITEDQLRELLEELKSGVYQVGTTNLDKAIEVVHVMANTILRVWADKKISWDDFGAARSLWIRVVELAKMWPALVQEATDLNVIDKVRMLNKGVKALSALMSALNQVLVKPKSVRKKAT
jgi:hypothetical protein